MAASAPILHRTKPAFQSVTSPPALCLAALVCDTVFGDPLRERLTMPVVKQLKAKEAAASVLCAGSLLAAGYDLTQGGSLGTAAAPLMILWLVTYFWLKGRWPLAGLRRGEGPSAARRPDTVLERLISWGATLLFALLIIGWSSR